MNTLHIIGNLTNDPQRRTAHTQNGDKTVCDFTVAVNRRDRGRDAAQFFRVTLWESMAENAVKYLKKGKKVAVTGAAEASAYIDRDGKPRASMEIRRVTDLEYLSSRTQDEADAGQEENASGYTQVEDEDLPF